MPSLDTLLLEPRKGGTGTQTQVGSWFLIEADNYTDLILNSVALGFLIEIDNMLSSIFSSGLRMKSFKCDLQIQ